MQPDTPNQPTTNGASPPLSGGTTNNPTVPQQSQNTPDNSGPIIGGPGFSNNSTSTSGNKKKRFILAGGILLGILLISGAASALFYFPNKPDAIWNKALTNSAKGQDKLIEHSKEQQDTKGWKAKGNFKVDAPDMVVDGNIDSKVYEKNSATKIDAGVAGTRFNAELLTNVPEGVKNPDIYVKVSGLKGIDQVMGSSEAGIGEALAAYDNQWFVIDHTLLDQAEKEAANSPENSTLSSLTNQDINSIVDTIGRVNKEYLFTSDSEKAVFTRKQDIGSEKLDDRSVYHYKAGYDKENLKEYMTALNKELKNTKLKDYIKDEDLKQQLESIDKMDANSDADVWVDKKTKLFRKVHLVDKDNKENYVDISLKYSGGDEYPFVLESVFKEAGKEDKGSISVTLNTKTSTTLIEANGDIKSEAEPFKFNLKLTVSPSNEKVEFKKPENAKSLLEGFGQLMGENPPSASDIQTQ